MASFDVSNGESHDHPEMLEDEYCPYNHLEVVAGLFTFALGSFSIYLGKKHRLRPRFIVLYGFFACAGILLMLSSHWKKFWLDRIAHFFVTGPLIVFTYLLHEDLYFFTFAQIHGLVAGYLICAIPYFYECHIGLLLIYIYRFISSRLSPFVKNETFRKEKQDGLTLFNTVILFSLIGVVVLIYSRWLGCQTPSTPTYLQPFGQILVSMAFYLAVIVFVYFREQLMCEKDRELLKYRSPEHRLLKYHIDHIFYFIPHIAYRPSPQ
eukprot:TRINITY_DN6058_c0_g2_i1.p1 TRINITY_DN6058_c0_g2~~TRINITY_DN6058_c0_g2_i1.p1  ORF type:complete len:265 (+),score=49.22 TRINITY_DN6058_c0_g2_i1:50-844(+)